MGTGTGKTLTSLKRVCANPTSKLLIVCPHNVLEQWEDVITSNFSDVKILHIKKELSAANKNLCIKNATNYNIIIVNFEILIKLPVLSSIVSDNWTIIIDESHRIKGMGNKTKRDKDGEKVSGRVKATSAALVLSDKTPWKIILTATPTQGNFGGYIDYYTQLKFLGYIDMTFEEFKKRYAVEMNMSIPGVPFPIPKIVGYKNISEIDSLLKLSCRYYKSKFGDFEPQHNKIMVTKSTKYARMVSSKVYDEIVLNNSARRRIAVKTMTTGTIIGKDLYGKDYIYVDNTIKLDWLEDFLKDTNETVAIYYQYNVELDALKALTKKLGKKTICINGATKNSYAEINHKNYDVMLGQYQAASQSLDGLQKKCHIMVLFSMPESSMLYTQSLGRINRDGQEQVPMYYYLIMKGTIDEQIYEMIEQKVEFSEAVLEGLTLKC